MYRRSGAGKIIYFVHLAVILKVADVRFDEAKLASLGDVAKVFRRSGIKAVDADHPISIGQKSFT
jgi:hypothetical protein